MIQWRATAWALVRREWLVVKGRMMMMLMKMMEMLKMKVVE